MMRRLSVFLFVMFALAGGFAAAAETSVEAMAVYYPHWHPYPQGEKIFGEGKSEWEFVKTQKPRYDGHPVPIRPTMGYYDETDPETVAKEIDLAADAGIGVFLYDWYSYDGTVMMAEALDRGFLKAANNRRMKFALMWCYHDRRNRFRAKMDDPGEPIALRAGTAEEFRKCWRYVLDRYFGSPLYYRKDGHPFFSIFNAADFVDKMGGPEPTKALLAEADAAAKAKGLPPIHWNAMHVFPDAIKRLEAAGFDSLSRYNITCHDLPDYRKRFEAGDQVFGYDEVAKIHPKVWSDYDAAEIPFLPTVTRGWDCSARCHDDERFPWAKESYPYSGIVSGNFADRSAAFRRLLEEAKKRAAEDPRKPGIVVLNAWNEYTEGCWLVPDEFAGRDSLDAVKSVFAAEKKLTPVMGWSSWNSFGHDVDREKVISQMDALVRLGLRDHGWTFVNIDDCYQDGRDPVTGRLRLNEKKFPGGYHGMRELVDYAHSLGLKAGIYSDGGDHSCASNSGEKETGRDVGFWRHEADDANMYMGEGIWRDTYAQRHPEDPGIECWGFDFIKIDWCGGGHAKLKDSDQYNRIMDEIDAVEKKTGKQKIVNICRWAYRGPWQFRADSWRCGPDIDMSGSSWESMTVQIDIMKELWQYTRPGSMNDPDMLVAGLKLTPDEDKSHFAMWCMFSAPMLIGQDLTRIRPETLALYKNDELIALNQDPAVLSAGYLGDLVPGVEIWVKYLGSDRSPIRAVALLNRNTAPVEVTFDYSLAGYTSKVKARDLFAHADLESATSRKVTLPPHGIDVLKLTPADEEPVVGPKFVSGRGFVVRSASVEEKARIDWVNAFAAVWDGATLLDVRTPEEYAAGHVEGAVNVPHTLVSEKISGVVADKSAAIVCYCRTYKRAAQAALTLDMLGYKNVRFVGDGYEASKSAPRVTLADVRKTISSIKGSNEAKIAWQSGWNVPWPSAKGKGDVGWSDKPISIAGTVYTNGIGTVSATRGGGSLVQCKIPDGATFFVAMAGVDDNTPVTDAPVVFAVQVDDRRVAETRPMVLGERHLFAVPLAAGARTLKLFTIGEKPVHASWGGAGFVIGE